MIVAILQARLSSNRLPQKVLMDLNGKPMLHHIVTRLRMCKEIDQIVVATSTDRSDDALAKWCRENQIDCFRGSLNNVLNRYFECAKKYSADTIIRITCDDPLKDSPLISRMIQEFAAQRPSLLTNNNPPSFPEGLDIEIFDFKSIEQANSNAETEFEKEHVTQHFYKNQNRFKILNLENDRNLSGLRFTVDTQSDLDFAREVYKSLDKGDSIFWLDEILEFLKSNPKINQINSNVKRSHMYEGKNAKNI